MELRFIHYNPEQLLEEKSFIDWVLRGKENESWEKFLDEHPEFHSSAHTARKIIELLRDQYDVLDERSLRTMWKNIRSYDLQPEKKRRTRIRRWIVRSAAAVFLLALGLAGYFQFFKADSYQFDASSTGGQHEEARMVLSTGEAIALNRDKSSIQINDREDQVIVNDSVVRLSESPIPEGKEVPMNEVVIPYGKSTDLLLADGTKVWLNAGSRLAFPSKFSGKERKVYLEGEACFKVTRNRDKPFIVQAGEVDLEVLGTWFDISAYAGDGSIETVLLEGSVAVHYSKKFGLGKGEVLLKPAQKAKFNREERNVHVTEVPHPELYIAWTEGWMQFTKESVNTVLTKLERYYDIEFRLPSHYPSNDLITGKLDLKESIGEVMKALSDVARINYRISGNEVYIEKKMKVLPRQ